MGRAREDDRLPWVPWLFQCLPWFQSHRDYGLHQLRRQKPNNSRAFRVVTRATSSNASLFTCATVCAT